MKWGVRRTPAQLGYRKEAKLNRYKEKEIRKVEKRMVKGEKNRQTYETGVQKRQTVYKNKASLTDKDKQRYKKQKEFDYNARKAFRSNKQKALAEINAIKKMSYKDMKREKIEVGKQVTVDILTTLGSYAAASVFPVGVYFISTPNPSAVKTDMRLKQGRYAKKKPKANRNKSNVSKK